MRSHMPKSMPIETSDHPIPPNRNAINIHSTLPKITHFQDSTGTLVMYSDDFFLKDL